jgi:hypothetical protein
MNFSILFHEAEENVVSDTFSAFDEVFDNKKAALIFSAFMLLVEDSEDKVSDDTITRFADFLREVV